MKDQNNDNLETLELKVKEDPKPLLPDGLICEAVVIKWEKGVFYGPKLYVHFKITSLGEYLEKILIRSYNFYNPLPNGCDLYNDLVKIKGERVTKSTYLSLTLFKNKVFEIKLKTVATDKRQMPRLEHQQYSKVDSIIRVVYGGKCDVSV